MSLSAQAKVLRALQENRICRVGSDKDIEVNVRVVAATNKNLRHEIELGNFREDLYHRLSVIVVRVPTLKERAEDIPALTDYFIQKICAEYGMEQKKIEPKALDELCGMEWPGNIRELENVCERAWLLSGGAAITKAHLPPRILEAAHGAQPGEEGGGLGEGFDAGAREGAPGDAPARNEIVASGSVDTVYYELIRSTLDACNGNLSKAAEQLGVARSTLYRRLRKFGIIE